MHTKCVIGTEALAWGPTSVRGAADVSTWALSASSALDSVGQASPESCSAKVVPGL